jgi:hypothetical protein
VLLPPPFGEEPADPPWPPEDCLPPLPPPPLARPPVPPAPPVSFLPPVALPPLPVMPPELFDPPRFVSPPLAEPPVLESPPVLVRPPVAEPPELDRPPGGSGSSLVAFSPEHPAPRSETVRVAIEQCRRTLRRWFPATSGLRSARARAKHRQVNIPWTLSPIGQLITDLRATPLFWQDVHVGSLVGAGYEPYPKLQRWLET